MREGQLDSQYCFFDNKYKAKESWKNKDGDMFYPGIH